MKITLNGQKKDFTTVQNLGDLINQFGARTGHIIAEVNGKIIKNPQWENTPVQEGDTIELLKFVGGGTSGPTST